MLGFTFGLHFGATLIFGFSVSILTQFNVFPELKYTAELSYKQANVFCF